MRRTLARRQTPALSCLGAAPDEPHQRRRLSKSIALLAAAVVLLAVAPPASASFQVIDVWGGSGTGDGQFSNPTGVAIDSSGNVYVTDNYAVQKFSSSGTFIARWSGSGGWGIAIDSSDNVYLSKGTGGNQIQKFSSSGEFITQWGSGGSGNGQFDIPLGVATDSSNNVYVVDHDNARVQKFSSSGAFITKWGSSGSGDGQFTSPWGVATDSSNNVYVVDHVDMRVQKFSSSGGYITQWGSENGQFGYPGGIAIDSSDNVYVTDFANWIQEFTTSGTFINSSDDAYLGWPYGLDINDSSGNIYAVFGDELWVLHEAPVTTINSGPSGPTNNPSPSFGFSSSAAGSSFECRLDSSQEADFQSCSSPEPYGPLADGAHQFEVRATDPAGNTDPTPAARTFTVDTAPPNTTITGGPSGTTNDPTPTFSFSSSQAGSSFQCRVDAGPYLSCNSPKTTSRLTDGSHTIYVRATDPAGNTDSTAASRSFTVRTASISLSGSTVVVTAAPGRKDNFAITRPSASVVRVTDFASGNYNGSVIHVGAGCTRSGDYTANCTSGSGFTLIQVSAADLIDKVVNSTTIQGSLNGGAGDDELTGGSSKDTLTGGAGIDSMKGMNGNDQLLGRDLISDYVLNCDGGSTPGGADKADLDMLPKDSPVSGCETVTRH